MGFRENSYATIWQVKTVSETLTNARISISRKNKQTGEYETDFSGFVSFVGTSAASKAANLKEKDRIKLLKTDVTNKYDKDKDVAYTNYKVFDFSTQDEMETQSSHSAPQQNRPDDGDVCEDEADDRLPF